MTGLQSHRSVSPLIDILRTILRGRIIKVCSLRFTDQLAARTQPHPNLPYGPYVKTAGMYYFTRDTRREVQPTIIVIARNNLAYGKKFQKLKYLTLGRQST